MYDLHYWPTPNGKKVTILLEELGVPYRIVPVQHRHRRSIQATNFWNRSQQPDAAIIDHAPNDGGAPIGVFEFGAIMMYIAEKEGKFYPQDVRAPLRSQPVADLADGQPGPEVGRMRPFPARSATSSATSPTRCAASPTR